MSGQIIELLDEVPLFNSLKPAELQTLARYFKLVEVRAHTVLFSEGDRGGYMCFVVRGELSVLKQAQAGETTEIAVLRKGRSIGEMAIIDNFTRSATVKALQPSKLAVLSRADFDLIVERYPEIGVKMLKSLARLLSMSLRQTSSQLADRLLPVA